MALPLLPVRPLTGSARVEGYLGGTDETSRQNSCSSLQLDAFSTNQTIEQAYRQIFFHAFKVDRVPEIESRFRSGQITTRMLVRELLLSKKFQNDFYRCNNNYRVVEQVIGRALGRPVHGQQERIAWSIVIAQQGLNVFVDAILNSAEYLDNFGEDLVPFQRSRVLAGQAVGEMPFNQQAPRYDAVWRDTLARRAPSITSQSLGWPQPAWLVGQPTPLVQKIWLGFVAAGGSVLVVLLIWIALAMLSTAFQG